MGRFYYIRSCIGDGLRSFSFVNFEDFRLSKQYKRCRVKINNIVYHYFYHLPLKTQQISNISAVGYYLPFQHNELFHPPYMAIAEISL